MLFLLLHLVQYTNSLPVGRSCSSSPPPLTSLILSSTQTLLFTHSHELCPHGFALNLRKQRAHVRFSFVQTIHSFIFSNLFKWESIADISFNHMHTHAHCYPPRPPYATTHTSIDKYAYNAHEAHGTYPYVVMYAVDSPQNNVQIIIVRIWKCKCILTSYVNSLF